MFDQLRVRLARMITPSRKTGGVRMYAGARNSRLTTGFGSYGNSSADAELSMGLTQLRARSRQLMRDAPYAKRARTIVVNNVVGAGVGLQAQVMTTRDAQAVSVNDGIESAWAHWSRAGNCHTGGALHMNDFERACMGQVFDAGEVFIRLHPRAFGDSKVPLALELIEGERLADEFTTPGAAVPANVKMGVEQDAFGRAIAYWIRDQHPGDLRGTMVSATQYFRVPADQIIHLRITDRWPQTRGEPWLHAVVRKLNDMEEYSGAELTAARMSANYFGTIESGDESPLGATTEEDGQTQYEIEPGLIQQLTPGDKFAFHSPNRPNAALDPFMRYMLREVAAGVGTSYESLSRDYSQSNYSSSRLALLDDRDLWRVLQQWWVRSFREPLHRTWLLRAVMAGAIPQIPVAAYAADPQRYEAVRWKLRGWSWVDPTKEVAAYKEAVLAGFITVSKVIELTGSGDDIEDVIEQRKRELAMFEEAGIEVDTTYVEPVEPALAPATEPATDPPPEPDDGDGTDPAATNTNDPRMRVVSSRS